MKIQKKKIRWGGWLRGGRGEGSGWGQGLCERRIKVFVKIKKIIFFFFFGGGVGSGGGGRVGGGQGGCERRIEVFEKIHKKKIGVGGLVAEGVRWGRGRVGCG